MSDFKRRILGEVPNKTQERVTIKGYVTKLTRGLTSTYEIPKISFTLKDGYKKYGSVGIYVSVVGDNLIEHFNSLMIKNGDKIKIYNAIVLVMEKSKYRTKITKKNFEGFLIGTDDNTNFGVIKRKVELVKRKKIKATELKLKELLEKYSIRDR